MNLREVKRKIKYNQGTLDFKGPPLNLQDHPMFNKTEAPVGGQFVGGLKSMMGLFLGMKRRRSGSK